MDKTYWQIANNSKCMFVIICYRITCLCLFSYEKENRIFPTSCFKRKIWYNKSRVKGDLL